MFARSGDYRNSRLSILVAPSPVLLAVILVDLLTASPCGATERYFPNKRAESSNQRYVVTATSPDNAEGEWKRAFQSRFKYRLFDQTEEREIWSREQPTREVRGGRRRATEGPPSAVYVSDDGWVVIRTADHGGPMELIVVSRAGEVTGRVKFSDTLFKRGPDHWTACP